MKQFLLLLFLLLTNSVVYSHGTNFLDYKTIIHKCGVSGSGIAFRIVEPYDTCLAGEGAFHEEKPHTAPKPAIVPTNTGLNYYVATNGSDSRTLTEAQNPATPWLTLQKAATAVTTPGATIHVATGTYNGLVTINTNGTAIARITFISDTPYAAKLQGTSNEAIVRVNGQFIDIKNFDITGTALEGILVTNSNNRIINNKVHDMNGSGISTWNETYTLNHVDILNNTVFNVGGTDHMQHGIYAMHQDSLIQNNVVYNIPGFGIHTWHNPKNLTISNNLVYSNGDGGITIGAGDAPYTGKAEGFVVSNNISINNGIYGIQEHGSLGQNQILNNIVFNNPTNLELTNVNTGTIVADPRLVNLGAGDYHLLSNSPAINAGTSIGAALLDKAGTARVGIPDIGVFEY